jgi:hypothetical protein
MFHASEGEKIYEGSNPLGTTLQNVVRFVNTILHHNFKNKNDYFREALRKSFAEKGSNRARTDPDVPALYCSTGSGQTPDGGCKVS